MSTGWPSFTTFLRRFLERSGSRGDRRSYVHARGKESRINARMPHRVAEEEDDGSFYYIVTRGAAGLRLSD